MTVTIVRVGNEYVVTRAEDGVAQPRYRVPASQVAVELAELLAGGSVRRIDVTLTAP